jgi:radical SAM protein with 4Fe4S-binding SPASM domain
VYEAVMAYCREQGLPLGGKLFYAVGALHDERGAPGHFCSVTHNELSVGPDGELLVCQAISESDYGRLEDMAGQDGLIIPPVLQQRTGDRVDGCAGCEVEGLCGGGCTAQSVRASGDAYGTPGPVFCTLVRGLFRRSMHNLLEDLAAGPADTPAPPEQIAEVRG